MPKLEHAQGRVGWPCLCKRRVLCCHRESTAAQDTAYALHALSC